MWKDDKIVKTMKKKKVNGGNVGEVEGGDNKDCGDDGNNIMTSMKWWRWMVMIWQLIGENIGRKVEKEYFENDDIHALIWFEEIILQYFNLIKFHWKE